MIYIQPSTLELDSLATSSMKHTRLFPSADTAVYLSQNLIVHHLEEHEASLGVHDLVGGRVFFLFVQPLGLQRGGEEGERGRERGGEGDGERGRGERGRGERDTERERHEVRETQRGRGMR